MDSLAVDKANDLVTHNGINAPDTPLVNDKYIIEKPADILNVIGAYYEKVNYPKLYDENTTLKKIVDHKANQLTDSFANNSSSISSFSDTNPASKPLHVANSLSFFNTLEAEYLFINLPNKCSSGFDNIPPILLKHLQIKFIRFYTILFNNCINLRYYPTQWKRVIRLFRLFRFFLNLEKEVLNPGSKAQDEFGYIIVVSPHIGQLCSKFIIGPE